MSDVVQGLPQLLRSLDDAARELSELAPDPVGASLATEVQATAPRASGYMASTVGHAGATVTVGAPYGVYVNARTGWAVKALEAQTKKITDLYGQAVADVVARVRGA